MNAKPSFARQHPLFVGIVSHVVVLLVVVVFVRGVDIVTRRVPSEEVSNEALWTVLAWAGTIAGISLLVIFIGHVLGNNRLSDQAKAAWSIAFVMLFPISVPLYWWIHWRPR